MTGIGIIGLLSGAILCSIWSGFVLSMLWAWIVVPTFGLSVITLAQAIGISLIVGYLTHQHTPSDNAQTGKLIERALVGPTIVLLIGWIVKQWI